jgi:hypothetical protein
VCPIRGTFGMYMTAPSPAGASDLTRRQALQAGGTVAAAAVVFLHPWATAVARAADGSDSAPKHLLRSSWRDLSDRDLRAGNVTLRLEAVGDLPTAPYVPSLVDSEDAFLLTFSGPGSVAAAGEPLRVRHDELGTFDIAVGPAGDDGKYYAVVNRVLSNKESRRTPPKAPKPAPVAELPVDEGHDTRTGAPESGDASAAKGGAKPKRRNKVIRSVETKRTKHGAKCVVELDSPAGLSEVTAWLKRDDRIVASAGRRVHGKRVAFNLKGAKKRFRSGVYQLTVIALGDDGEQHARNVRVRLK